MAQNSFCNKPKKKTEIIRHICMICMAGVFLILMSSCQNVLKKDSIEKGVLYRKEEVLNYVDLKTKTVKKITEWKDHEQFYPKQEDILTQISSDGKKIVYPQDVDEGNPDLEYQLFYREIQRDGLGEAIKIGDNIWEYQIDENFESIVYIGDQENTLKQFYFKNKSEENIDTQVSSFQLSKDGKSVVYTTYSGESYYKEIGKGRELLADNDIHIFYHNDDFSVLVFQVGDQLIRKEVGKQGEIILQGFEKIISYHADGKIYYLVEESLAIDPWEYVEDDLLQQDNQIQEPKEIGDLPVEEEYSSEEVYRKAMDEYTDSIQKYELYKTKLIRDELREKSKQGEVVIPRYTFYYYDGNTSQILLEHVSPDELLLKPEQKMEKPVAFLAKYIPAPKEKIKFSSLKKDYSDEESLMKMIISNYVEYYVVSEAIVGKPITIKTPLTFPYQRTIAMVSKQGNALYYKDSVDDGELVENLYRVDIKDNEITEPILYAENVATFSSKLLEDGRILYHKKMSAEKDSFFVDHKEFFQDVSFVHLEERKDGQTDIFLLNNWDYDQSTYDLWLVRENKLYEVGKNIIEYYCDETGEISYLKSNNTWQESGNLYYFVPDGEDILLDSGVGHLLDPSLTFSDFE